MPRQAIPRLEGRMAGQLIAPATEPSVRTPGRVHGAIAIIAMPRLGETLQRRYNIRVD